MTTDNSNLHTLAGNWETRDVILDGAVLLPGPSQKLHNHSPDGFCWGYAGSGPAQLALAICLKLLDPEKATRVYQNFKDNIIAALPQRDFNIRFWLNDEGTSSGILSGNWETREVPHEA